MRSFINGMTLKTKMLIGFLLVGLIPAVTLSVLSYVETKISTHHQVDERLE